MLRGEKKKKLYLIQGASYRTNKENTQICTSYVPRLHIAHLSCIIQTNFFKYETD